MAASLGLYRAVLRTPVRLAAPEPVICKLKHWGWFRAPFGLVGAVQGNDLTMRHMEARCDVSGHLDRPRAIIGNQLVRGPGVGCLGTVDDNVGNMAVSRMKVEEGVLGAGAC